MTLDEAESRLVLARRIPFPKDWVQLVSGHVRRVLLCADLRRHAAQRIGGALAAFLPAGICCCAGGTTCRAVSARSAAAALITLVCILGCHLLGTEASHAIIGTLMILTPGIAFTMGIRDFVQGDYLSGTIRMIDALLIAASIAIGTGLVLSLYAFLKGVAVV